MQRLGVRAECGNVAGATARAPSQYPPPVPIHVHAHPDAAVPAAPPPPPAGCRRISHSIATPGDGPDAVGASQGRPVERPLGPSGGDERRHREPAPGAGEGAQRDRREGDLEPPFQVRQRGRPPAVGAERLPQQGSSAAQHEAPVRRQPLGAGTEVGAGEQLSRAGPACSQRPSAVTRRYSPAPSPASSASRPWRSCCTAIPPLARSQRHPPDPKRAGTQRGIGPVAAVGG